MPCIKSFAQCPYSIMITFHIDQDGCITVLGRILTLVVNVGLSLVVASPDAALRAFVVWVQTRIK